MVRIYICDVLTKRNEIDPFLERMSKPNEASQTVAKPGLTAKKLPYGQTLNSDLYCRQLDRLKLGIDQKRPELTNRRGVVCHQDNARPHTSIITRQKIQELNVSMHPPYRPDLAPSDYHVSLALQNFLNDKKLALRKDCESGLQKFFANRGQDIYEIGIMKVPLKWQQITEEDGAYLI
ncbi:histone-lysine N-methyltransferase SETMAR-like [Augochlora pura]